MWLVPCFLLIFQIVGGDEPPIAGRPPGISGAVGDFRFFTTSADPTELQAEDRIRFTVQIRCVGACRQPPLRPKLQVLPDFSQRFAIEDDLSSSEEGGLSAVSSTWTFRYSLRPLNADVTEIPALRFDYYRPGIVPPEKGYQTRYSDPIPLRVRPRRVLEASDVQAAHGTSVPESVIPRPPDWSGWQSSLISFKPILVAIALGGLLTACILMGHWWHRRTPWSCRLGVVAMVIVAAASLGWLLAQRQITPDNRHPNVVIATDGVELRTGDGQRYPVTGERILNRGTEAQVLYQRGDWVQIELPQGGIGWVMAKDVLIE